MSDITIYRGRKATITASLYLADGVTGVALEAADVVKFRLGRLRGVDNQQRGAALLAFDSGAASANGSTVNVLSLTAPASVQINIVAADTLALPAELRAGELRDLGYELSFTDNSDSDYEKTITSGGVDLQDRYT